jgi:hypothetical protein
MTVGASVGGTVSAVYEAERYGVAHALMLVHAFVEDDGGFADFQRFVRALELPAPGMNVLSELRKLEAVDLRLGWVQDHSS